MNPKNTSDLDVVTSLLADKSDFSASHMGNSTSAPQNAENALDQLCSIVALAKIERGIYSSIQDRSIRKSLQQIELSGFRSRSYTNSSRTRPFLERFLAISPLQIGLAVVPLLIVALCGVYLMQIRTDSSSSIRIAKDITATEKVYFTKANPTISFIDFEFSGAELGTRSQPFQSLSASIDNSDAGDIFMIKSGVTMESLKIYRPVILVAMEGHVRIGN